jgi:hypothetical protein
MQKTPVQIDNDNFVLTSYLSGRVAAATDLRVYLADRDLAPSYKNVLFLQLLVELRIFLRAEQPREFHG